MFLDILNTFCQYTGYDPIQGRNAAAAYINRASKDLYNSLEADALMRETVLVVPAGTQISLPPFIGELRGLREYNWSTTVPINQIGVPRFSSDTQKYLWRNWTLKNKQPLANSISNASILQFNVLALDTINNVITVNGRTANSHKVVESITLNATVVSTINSFAAIDSITSSSTRSYDIDIYDVANNYLATLYNNESKTEYIIADVSTYSWIAQVGDGATTLMEVLYKTKFYNLINDTDEFPAPGYDDAIAYKAIVLWTISQEGQETLALSMNALAKAVIDSNVTNAERGQVLKIQHQKNSVYDIFYKLKRANNWRRGGWRWGKWS